MALTRAYVRCFAAVQLKLDDILARVNQMLLNDLEHGHFVTLFLARLNPDHRSLSYASAGHLPSFVFLESGELKCALDSTGPPLGLFSGSKFSLRPAMPLDPGEIVRFLTDGIAESITPDGHQFGSLGVLDYVQAHNQGSARTLRMASTRQLGRSCKVIPGRRHHIRHHQGRSFDVGRASSPVCPKVHKGNPFASNFFLAPGS
jgi:phosphoserine phosphatase RsbU/P